MNLWCLKTKCSDRPYYNVEVLGKTMCLKKAFRTIEDLTAIMMRIDELSDRQIARKLRKVERKYGIGGIASPSMSEFRDWRLM